MKICLKCLQLYDDNKMTTTKCPKIHCIGNIVEIDELMIPAVIKFRKTGYETTFCCQGHIEDVYNWCDTYIAFSDKSFEKLILNNSEPPRGWTYVLKGSLRPVAVLTRNEYLDVSRDFSNDNILENFHDKYNYITNLMNNLYDWLEKLR